MKIVDSAKIHAASSVSVGDQVSVDGLQGRGMVVSVQGNRVTVKFRNALEVKRDVRFVHIISNRAGAQ